MRSSRWQPKLAKGPPAQSVGTRPLVTAPEAAPEADAAAAPSAPAVLPRRALARSVDAGPRRLGSVADHEKGSYALSSMTSASATPS
jgi:hypothetical protein